MNAKVKFFIIVVVLMVAAVLFYRLRTIPSPHVPGPAAAATPTAAPARFSPGVHY